MVTEEITLLHLCVFSRFLIFELVIVQEGTKCTAAPAVQYGHSPANITLEFTDDKHTHSCICAHYYTKEHLCTVGNKSETTGSKFASSSLSKLSPSDCAQSFSFVFFMQVLLCHIWCLLNKNNHKNHCGFQFSSESISPCAVLYALILHQSIWPSPYWATPWLKLHVQTAVIDWIMCFAGRRLCAQQLCVRGCWGKAKKKITEKNAVSVQLTCWLLESFGRVDDHMQKAVQARSLLIWKTSAQRN